MLPLKKPLPKAQFPHASNGCKSRNGRVLPDAGLLLLDNSLRLIAADSGATAILSYSEDRNASPGILTSLPPELLNVIRGRSTDDCPWTKSPFSIGGREYILRVYLIHSPAAPLTRPMLALHLEHDGFAAEVVSEVSEVYNLTHREQEAFAGILMGLSTKEVAQRMNISPNTVKAFLRLIMIKMGVTTRAGILARILHDRSGADTETSGAALAAGGMV